MTDEGKHLKESKEPFTQSFSKNTKKPQDNKSATTSTVTKDISKLSKMVRPWSDPISPCSQPTEEELTHLLYITKCDFSARINGDLSIKRGDLLYIMNSDDHDWWLAEIKHSGQQGYIPSDYVVKYKSDLDTEISEM